MTEKALREQSPSFTSQIEQTELALKNNPHSQAALELLQKEAMELRTCFSPKEQEAVLAELARDAKKLGLPNVEFLNAYNNEPKATSAIASRPSVEINPIRQNPKK